MKIGKVDLPEKVFGMETGLLIVFLPLAGVLLLAIVSINLVILPKLNDYQQSKVQLTTLSKQTKDLDDKRKYLLSINQEDLKKNSDYISNALLPQKNSYVLVGVVRKIADSYGYQVDSFSVSPGKMSKDDASAPKVVGVAAIPVSLSLVGPNEKYLDLIKGLENSLPVLALQNFDMQNLGAMSKISLTIDAYYIDDNATFDISKLTLADLTLTKVESDLLARLNTFTVLDSAGLDSEFDTTKKFVKYDRVDPFSL